MATNDNDKRKRGFGKAVPLAEVMRGFGPAVPESSVGQPPPKQTFKSPAEAVVAGASPEAVWQATGGPPLPNVNVRRMAPLESATTDKFLGLDYLDDPAKLAAIEAKMPQKTEQDVKAMKQFADESTNVLRAAAPAEVFGPLGELLPNSKRAGAAFERLQKLIGKHPVYVTNELSRSLTAVQEAAERGATMPTAVRKLVLRLTNPEKGPLTYEEARGFYENIGNLSANEKGRLNSNMHRMVNGLRVALNDTITQTARRAGEAEQFQGAMREYRRVSQARKVGKYAKKVGAGAVGLGGAYELYNAVKGGRP